MTMGVVYLIRDEVSEAVENEDAQELHGEIIAPLLVSDEVLVPLDIARCRPVSAYPNNRNNRN